MANTTGESVTEQEEGPAIPLPVINAIPYEEAIRRREQAVLDTIQPIATAMDEWLSERMTMQGGRVAISRIVTGFLRLPPEGQAAIREAFRLAGWDVQVNHGRRELRIVAILAKDTTEGNGTLEGGT